MFIGIVTKLLLYGTFCIAVKYCFVCVCWNLHGTCPILKWLLLCVYILEWNYFFIKISFEKHFWLSA